MKSPEITALPRTEISVSWAEPPTIQIEYYSTMMNSTENICNDYQQNFEISKPSTVQIYHRKKATQCVEEAEYFQKSSTSSRRVACSLRLEFRTLCLGLTASILYIWLQLTNRLNEPYFTWLDVYLLLRFHRCKRPGRNVAALKNFPASDRNRYNLQGWDLCIQDSTGLRTCVLQFAKKKPIFTGPVFSQICRKCCEISTNIPRLSLEKHLWYHSHRNLWNSFVRNSVKNLSNIWRHFSKICFLWIS